MTNAELQADSRREFELLEEELAGGQAGPRRVRRGAPGADRPGGLSRRATTPRSRSSSPSAATSRPVSTPSTPRCARASSGSRRSRPTRPSAPSDRGPRPRSSLVSVPTSTPIRAGLLGMLGLLVGGVVVMVIETADPTHRHPRGAGRGRRRPHPGRDRPPAEEAADHPPLTARSLSKGSGPSRTGGCARRSSSSSRIQGPGRRRSGRTPTGRAGKCPGCSSSPPPHPGRQVHHHGPHRRCARRGGRDDAGRRRRLPSPRDRPLARSRPASFAAGHGHDGSRSGPDRGCDPADRGLLAVRGVLGRGDPRGRPD